MILFQEVIDEMYTVLKRRLPSWSVYRRPDSGMMYYLVTAVRCPRQSDEDDAGSRLWPESGQRRHSLRVRRAGLTVINVHVESGGGLSQVVARRSQIDSLARAHEESDGATSTILAGDFNARVGEDDSLLNGGWTDACSSAGDWTWKQGNSSARYDRVYYRASDFQCYCATVEGVYDTHLSDHKPLLVELRRREAVAGCHGSDNAQGAAAGVIKAGGGRGLSTTGATVHVGNRKADELSLGTDCVKSNKGALFGHRAHDDSAGPLHIMNQAVDHVFDFRAAVVTLKIADDAWTPEQEPLPARVENFAYTLGALMVGFLLVFAVTNDIFRWVG